MSAYPVMEQVQRQLEAGSVRALLPAREDQWHTELSEQAFLDFKRSVSRGYLREIRRRATAAVLVVNPPKRGIENYIGANTFAEIAMAFDARKPIYLLHDCFEPFLDELTAWNAVPLHGNISRLVRLMERNPEPAQMELLPPAALAA